MRIGFSRMDNLCGTDNIPPDPCTESPQLLEVAFGGLIVLDREYILIALRSQ